MSDREAGPLGPATPQHFQRSAYPQPIPDSHGPDSTHHRGDHDLIIAALRRHRAHKAAGRKVAAALALAEAQRRLEQHLAGLR